MLLTRLHLTLFEVLGVPELTTIGAELTTDPVKKLLAHIIGIGPRTVGVPELSLKQSLFQVSYGEFILVHRGFGNHFSGSVSRLEILGVELGFQLRLGYSV